MAGRATENDRSLNEPMNWTAIVAILAIAAIEVTALVRGVNGAEFGLVIAAIAGLAGYQVHNIVTRRRQNKLPAGKEGAEQS